MSRKSAWLRAKRARERVVRADNDKKIKAKTPEEKGVTYTSTAPAKISSDGGIIEYAENERGYETVMNAETGSLVVAHFPRQYSRLAREILDEHDEYYEVKQNEYKNVWSPKSVHLLYRGSSLPRNAGVEGYWPNQASVKAENVRLLRKSLIGRTSSITIISPESRMNLPEYVPWPEDYPNIRVRR